MSPLADVFISYAREDQAAVRRLHEALVARGRETWVDWEGIEPSDQWLQSILEAIDAADAVVVMLSPDWLDSKICRAEAEHASEANKRLIPVVARGVEERREDVPAVLADLNWVFARPEVDDLDAAADLLVHALEIDLALVRTHTLVLTRARAWELAGRRNSTLLRADELRRAEEWLARAAAGTKPQPTELQASFIQASRNASRRRTRLAVGGSLTVAAVSIVLAVLALVSRDQAIHESHVASSRELTADSTGELSADPELSLLLAQKALDTNANPSTKLAFVTALDDTAVRALVHAGGGDGGILADAWSPRANLVALAGANGTVTLWDPLRGRVVKTLHAGGSVDSVAFSGDGSQLASGGSDERVSIWSVATGKRLRSLPGHTAPVDAIAWSADNRYVISGARDGTARVWNVASGAQLAKLSDPNQTNGAVTGVAFGPRDNFVVTANGTDGYTVVWGLHPTGFAPAAVYRPKLQSQAPDEIALSSNGELIAIAGGDGKVRLWNWRLSTAKVRVITASTDPLQDVAFSGGDKLVAASGLDGTARIWSVASGQLLQADPGDRGTVNGVAFSPNGKWLASAGADGVARVWKVTSTSGAVLGTRGPGGPIPELVAGAISPSGVAVAADGGGVVHAWHLLQGGQLWQHRVSGVHAGCSCTLSFDRKGTLLAVGASTGVELLRGSDGRSVRSITAPVSTNAAEISPDGTLVAAAGSDGDVRVWSSGGKTRYTFKPGRSQGDAGAVQFSPGGDLLAVGLSSGAVQLLDAATGNPLGTLSGPTGAVLALAFSPNGQLLAGGSADRRGWLWNVSSRGVVQHFEGDTAPVDAVAISPNGEFLATGSDDHTGRIWDLHTGDEVRLLSGDTDWVSWVGFSPSGADIVSTSFDGTLHVWDSCAWCESTAELEAHAKPAIVRCFTADELDTYLHETDAKNESCAA